MSKAKDTLKEVVQESSALSSPYRLLAMAYLLKNRKATWSTIMQYIEEKIGKTNPNTLHFHLKILIENGYIKRSGGEKAFYELGNDSDLNDIVKKYAVKANLF